ncbi:MULTISPECIES: bifunctional D-glycero-beta-D-manno-heptose-7-phosphate kinase/D-glycero-beta-D-manno-heptose 1-phosphate adenylyltransferase HldE [unclassified Moritella]|uniref:bifunctional D-glycero-beta-D-manno-heptose-7-phosphate kinase/D-glycero-beta-D-manno-heptose 1-phosphate adenylyltransferase HldE n=1 Tax=unclassified Moritella TaxID=2637987 RepID=UPI001BA8CDB8|nr:MULTISPECIES: bifunctional D-glycero-beta-D-manno-heptose-7-phosphate kinase/D-glycero-beta-D-manno-heptose 1-phosphate adenylyltransferase HldE [unclassified Moritella]QUM86922.1 bifunctional D-glycero-beta-D-manno-heptose-7-phosphate kinase/D-glycero-beta-D-manno-heptose 1-phosphate adenylyltransferase HldE [Moritella sp. 28]QUM91144.1 bifunctional D-glycero-beta-D-manno-heptose-7-phosphate kinase/D-glycero-beta-D-manno-heptose 1-phosphate adenylyltransferase HldE [Moritella sp. 36]
MEIILPDFNNSKILVVGDVMLDRYWTGDSSRISPEAPVPIVKVNNVEDRPGGAANVALNLAALGASTKLLGLTGNDEAAQALCGKMNAVDVICDFLQLDDYPTITKLRVLSRGQQVIRLDFEESVAAVDTQPLVAKTIDNFSDYSVMIVSDYNKGALVEVQQMIQAAKQQGVKVFVDPKGCDFEKYRGATLLTPNLSEFEAVVGHCKNEQDLVEKGRKLITEYDLEALLVTRSEKGMTLIRAEQDEFHLPALAQEVYDVTGAGDTVISVLAAAVSAGSSLEEACALANAGASVVVAKIGTSTVSPIELANSVYGSHESGFGVLSEEQLKIAVKSAKLRGEEIVMTNGCFDILHAGHVSYLNSARKLGQRLILAVNSDASVRGLKGSGRPINTCDRRMTVLAALGAVDWVVEFVEETPERLISELLPDVLVKGGDYKVEEIAGHKQVLANGGKVNILQFEDGCSTTAIINAIKR